ncbi:MAG: cysteine--tRNA ligase [Candidatus Andersenbacteria bacterium]
MPDLLFYNSFTKQVEPLRPQEPGKVRLYHCGPTVYKRQHIGNMRRFLFADYLRRTLEFFGYEVREITNITDVGHLTQDEIDAGEDKMERAAKEAKVTPQVIADKQIAAFIADVQALNIQLSHKYPRATQHIPQMQQLITQLLEKQYAYQTTTGIYFDVQSFPAYGKLSGNTLENIAAGKRVAIREEKKHPADFALWIFDKQSLQRWDSPWGEGFPGWHIECSAMSLEYLGSGIDIHTGGEDNRFPHHENEIAQSEAATGESFVRLWMHNRHLHLSGQKLAKRAGEQITLDTIKEKGFTALAFRLLVFSVHYRTPMDFSWEALAAAEEHVRSLRGTLRRLLNLDLVANQADATVDREVTQAFGKALADDLNTPQAWTVFLQYVRTINTALETTTLTTAAAKQYLTTLFHLDHVLGVLQPLRYELEAEHIPAEITDLAKQRERARQGNQFVEADRLRTILESKGYYIEDTPSGPRIMPK